MKKIEYIGFKTLGPYMRDYMDFVTETLLEDKTVLKETIHYSRDPEGFMFFGERHLDSLSITFEIEILKEFCEYAKGFGYGKRKLISFEHAWEESWEDYYRKRNRNERNY
jgi:hypothetical protein